MDVNRREFIRLVVLGDIKTGNWIDINKWLGDQYPHHYGKTWRLIDFHHYEFYDEDIYCNFSLTWL